jgi:hypothetical protein
MKATAPIREAGLAPALAQALLYRTEENVQRQGLHGGIGLQKIA